MNEEQQSEKKQIKGYVIISIKNIISEVCMSAPKGVQNLELSSSSSPPVSSSSASSSSGPLGSSISRAVHVPPSSSMGRTDDINEFAGVELGEYGERVGAEGDTKESEEDPLAGRLVSRFDLVSRDEGQPGLRVGLEPVEEGRGRLSATGHLGTEGDLKNRALSELGKKERSWKDTVLSILGLLVWAGGVAAVIVAITSNPFIPGLIALCVLGYVAQIIGLGMFFAGLAAEDPKAGEKQKIRETIDDATIGKKYTGSVNKYDPGVSYKPGVADKTEQFRTELLTDPKYHELWKFEQELVKLKKEADDKQEAANRAREAADRARADAGARLAGAPELPEVTTSNTKQREADKAHATFKAKEREIAERLSIPIRGDPGKKRNIDYLTTALHGAMDDRAVAKGGQRRAQPVLPSAPRPPHPRRAAARSRSGSVHSLEAGSEPASLLAPGSVLPSQPRWAGGQAAPALAGSAAAGVASPPAKQEFDDLIAMMEGEKNNTRPDDGTFSYDPKLYDNVIPWLKRLRDNSEDDPINADDIAKMRALVQSKMKDNSEKELAARAASQKLANQNLIRFFGENGTSPKGDEVNNAIADHTLDTISELVEKLLNSIPSPQPAPPPAEAASAASPSVSPRQAEVSSPAPASLAPSPPLSSARSSPRVAVAGENAPLQLGPIHRDYDKRWDYSNLDKLFKQYDSWLDRHEDQEKTIESTYLKIIQDHCEKMGATPAEISSFLKPSTKIRDIKKFMEAVHLRCENFYSLPPSSLASPPPSAAAPAPPSAASSPPLSSPVPQPAPTLPSPAAPRPARPTVASSPSSSSPSPAVGFSSAASGSVSGSSPPDKALLRAEIAEAKKRFEEKYWLTDFFSNLDPEEQDYLIDLGTRANNGERPPKFPFFDRYQGGTPGRLNKVFEWLEKQLD